MVKENTHLFIAKKIFEKINQHKSKNLKKYKNYKHISEIIENNIDEYYIGSIILDSFYYIKKHSKYSNFFHGVLPELNIKNNEIILDIIKTIKLTQPNNSENVNIKKTSQDLAFVFGFITHYVSDLKFHPFIEFYSKQNNENSEMYNHLYLETKLDQVLNNEISQDNLIKPNKIKNLQFNQILAKAFNLDTNKIANINISCLKRQINFNKKFKNNFYYNFLKICNQLKLIKNSDFQGLFYHNLKKKHLFGEKLLDLNYKFEISDPKKTNQLNHTSKSIKSNITKQQPISINQLTQDSINTSIQNFQIIMDYLEDKITLRKLKKAIPNTNLANGYIIE